MSPRGKSGKRVFDELVMIRMTAALRHQLEHLAERDGRPLAQLCRIVLERFAEEPETRGKQAQAIGK